MLNYPLKLIVLLATALFTAASVQASVLPIYSEGFEYANGFLNGNGGWVDGGSTQYDVVDKTWATWGGYSTIADKASGTLRGTAGGGVNATVNLGTTIDSETTGTYYVSYTLNGDDIASGGWYNFVVRNTSGSSTTSDANNLYAQFNGGSKAFNNTDFGSILTGAGADIDLLIIGRIDFATGSDTGYFSVFQAGESIGTLIANETNSGANFGFEATATPTITGSLDQLLVRINNDTLTGNIRIGTTLTSVIPEPASFALLGMGSLLILSRKR